MTERAFRFAVIITTMMAISSCRSTSPFSIGITTDKPVYSMGDTITVEASVENLRDSPIAYCATEWDLIVYPIDETGERILSGLVDVVQPDGSIVTVVATLGGSGAGGMPFGWHFVRLSPHEKKIFKKEFVAKIPGRYEAEFQICSPTDVEESPDPDWPPASRFPGPSEPSPSPKPKRKPEPIRRKVENAWVGSIPPKTVVFEVRE